MWFSGKINGSGTWTSCYVHDSWATGGRVGVDGPTFRRNVGRWRGRPSPPTSTPTTTRSSPQNRGGAQFAKKKKTTELWSTVPTCSGRDFPFVFVRFSFSPHLAARLSPYKSQPGIAINCIVLLSKENRIVSQPMRVHCFYFRPKSLSFVLFLSLNRRFLKATAVSCRAQFVTSSFE